MEWNQLITNKRYPSKPEDQKMTCSVAFDSDYRRIVKSAAFRRLQDKTQVFPLDRNDFVRTRLTHSLEVAMLSRDILQSVHEEFDRRKMQVSELSSAFRLLECASLIHDIGNPPFGHFGEESIRIWFKENMDKYDKLQRLSDLHKAEFLHFEGNAQSLRILTKIHNYNGATISGMRLSVSVVDAIIKYIGNALEIDKKNILYKKVGYFDSEKDEFQAIKEATQTTHMRNPLVYLLEGADDISYTFSDLEDGYNYGMYSIHDLEAYVGMNDLFLKGNTNDEKMQHFLREMQDRVFKQASICFVEQYDLIMNGTYTQDLFIQDNETMILFDKLKKFCFDSIFEHDTIIKLEITSYQIIKSLLDTFIPLVLKLDTLHEYEDKLLRFIPDYAFDLFKVESEGKSEEEKIYYQVKIALDFICGMSDGYAKKLYQEIYEVK